MTGFDLLLGTLGLLAGLGILEGLRHRRTLARIPIRIHVNGTRGKSSVTRLIAAGLRAGGITTCAKTTGTLARMILPNGTEYPVFRPSRANVMEQLRIIRTAAELKSQALVIECMAVQPFLQSLSEMRFVAATHGVITNARADHLDVMGPTEDDVALALAATTPRKGILYTGERRHLDTFRMSATDRASELVPITEDDVSAIAEADLAPFSYLEHAENVALALRVCGALGVDRQTALKGMWSARPDPGALTAFELDFFGRNMVFVNAFAANDPESTGRIWQMVRAKYADRERVITIVNCRADRADRSRQLGEACLEWGKSDHFVLIGSGTYIFARSAITAGLDPTCIHYAEDQRIDEIFEVIADLAGPSALVIGVANIGGPGLDLVRFFRNRSKLISPRQTS